MGQGMPGGGAPARSNSGVTTSGSTAAGAVGTGVRAPRIINDPNVGGGPSAEPGGASSAMHGRNNYSDATSRFRNYLHNPSPRIVAPGRRGKVGNCCGGTGSGGAGG